MALVFDRMLKFVGSDVGMSDMALVFDKRLKYL